MSKKKKSYQKKIKFLPLKIKFWFRQSNDLSSLFCSLSRLSKISSSLYSRQLKRLNGLSAKIRTKGFKKIIQETQQEPIEGVHRKLRGVMNL